jgi:hypothetical protein
MNRTGNGAVQLFASRVRADALTLIIRLGPIKERR